MNNMIVTINNQDYVVTDMIEMGKNMDKVYKWNKERSELCTLREGEGFFHINFSYFAISE